MYQLGYLAEHLEFIPTIAQWYFQMWGHYRAGDSVELRIGRLTEAANRKYVPTVIVAYEGRGEGSGIGNAGGVRHEDPQ